MKRQPVCCGRWARTRTSRVKWFGNGVPTQHEVDARSGRLTDITTGTVGSSFSGMVGNIQKLGFSWESLGNLPLACGVTMSFYHTQGMPMKLSSRRNVFAPTALLTAAIITLTGCFGGSMSAHDTQSGAEPQSYRLQSVVFPWLDEFGNTLSTERVRYIYTSEHELARIEEQSVNSLPNDEFVQPIDIVYQQHFIDETAGSWIVEVGVTSPEAEEFYPRDTQHWQDFELQYTMASVLGWDDESSDSESSWAPLFDRDENPVLELELPSVSSSKSFGDRGELLAKNVMSKAVIGGETQLKQTVVIYEYNAHGLPDTIVSVTYSGSSRLELTPTGEREELVFHYPPGWSQDYVEVTVERSRYRDGELIEHQEQVGLYARQPCGEWLAARSKLKTPDPLPWCFEVDSAIP